MFNRLSIRQKLTAMLMLISGAVLALASVAFVTWDFYQYRADMQADIVTQAQLVLENTAAAVTFSDPAAAIETLEMLEIHPHTQLACLYLPGGAAVRVEVVWRRPRDRARPSAVAGRPVRHPTGSTSPSSSTRGRGRGAILLIADDLDGASRTHLARRPPRSRPSSSPAC